MATVLLVEDDQFCREAVELILVQDGHTVLSARDGMGALDLLTRVKPDLVLLDIAMPGISGLEVLKLMRARRALAAVPVLMVTANSDAPTVRQAMTAGASGYMLKPCKPEALRARIAHLLAPVKPGAVIQAADDELTAYI